MKPDDQIVIDSNPDPQDVQFLDERITEYNFETTGITDGKLVSCFIRDEKGEIRAGIYGWTWGETCEIRDLWVHKDWRGQGLGTKLLLAVEVEARARGCKQMVLDTHTFQAPEFYKRFGYEVAGAIDDYPKGYQHIFMRKVLS